MCYFTLKICYYSLKRSRCNYSVNTYAHSAVHIYIIIMDVNTVQKKGQGMIL